MNFVNHPDCVAHAMIVPEGAGPNSPHQYHVYAKLWKYADVVKYLGEVYPELPVQYSFVPDPYYVDHPDFTRIPFDQMKAELATFVAAARANRIEPAFAEGFDFLRYKGALNGCILELVRGTAANPIMAKFMYCY